MSEGEYLNLFRDNNFAKFLIAEGVKEVNSNNPSAQSVIVTFWLTEEEKKDLEKMYKLKNILEQG